MTTDLAEGKSWSGGMMSVASMAHLHIICISTVEFMNKHVSIQKLFLSSANRGGCSYAQMFANISANYLHSRPPKKNNYVICSLKSILEHWGWLILTCCGFIISFFFCGKLASWVSTLGNPPTVVTCCSDSGADQRLQTSGSTTLPWN